MKYQNLLEIEKMANPDITIRSIRRYRGSRDTEILYGTSTYYVTEAILLVSTTEIYDTKSC